MHSNQLELLVARQPGERMLNAGVLLIRDTANVHKFFTNVTSSRIWNDNWCEQSSNEAWTTHQLQSTTMKVKQEVLQTLCKFNDKECNHLSFPTDDIFVLHLAHSKYPQVQELLKSLL